MVNCFPLIRLEETLDNKLIISDFHKEHMLGFQLEENKLTRIYDFHSESIIGNIYCGYVKDVVKNLNAAFIEFDTDKKGYYLLKDDAKKICQGDKVLIQVAGDKIKTKDYLLTSAINFTSECLVLTVQKPEISVSRKINNKHVREYLKSILNKFKNDEYGFILRTNSVNYTAKEIENQAEKLIERWINIQKKFEHAAFRSVLLKNDFLLHSCSEYLEKYHGEIVTDSNVICDKLKCSDIPVNFEQNTKINLCNKYSLEKHLRQALSKKVWMKSGAYLVIEPTEALTVIDVNTGKADCKSNREKTFKKINFEAALEIARQTKIRNLSGIIIIDFINMKNPDDYTELKRLMENAVQTDFSPCSIVGFTKLGLMEMSRKKKEKPLFEILSEEQLQ